MALVFPYIVGPEGPAGADGADGADGAGLTVVTYLATGDIAEGAHFDVVGTGMPTQGCVVAAHLTATVGALTSIGASIYNGDPGGLGTLAARVVGEYGGGSPYTSVPTGDCFGPLLTFGGSSLKAPVPYRAGTPWIRLSNGTFETSGRLQLRLWILPTPDPT